MTDFVCNYIFNPPWTHVIQQMEISGVLKSSKKRVSGFGLLAETDEETLDAIWQRMISLTEPEPQREHVLFFSNFLFFWYNK